MTVTGVSPPCDYTLFRIVVGNWSFGGWIIGGFLLSALSAGLTTGLIVGAWVGRACHMKAPR